LNSLKGVFKIDFNESTLANAGLFAITGPTGAGKSTILDAITLALYCYTPRIGDVTKSAISDKGVIVTKHTNDAFAHIVIEINNETYKAEWTISKTRNKTWGEVIHKLSRKVGGNFDSITEKKSDTYNEVVRIIGLNENQFTKAIVLSQGKFDEFLKSKKDDRYALLEIITGTQIYREIGKKVFQSLKDIDLRISDLSKQMGGIVLLTEGELSEIDDRKKEFQEDVSKLAPEIEKLNKLKQNKELLKKLNEEFDKINNQVKELEQKVAAFQPQLIQLNNHEKALPLQVEYNNWNQSLKAIDAFKKAIEQKTDLLNVQNKKLEELIKKLSDEGKMPVEKNNFLSQLDSFFEKISLLDKEISNLESSMNAQLPGMKEFYKQIPESSINDIISIRKSVPDLQSFIQSSEDKINQLGLPDDLNSSTFESYLETTYQKKTTLEKAIEKKNFILKNTEAKNESIRKELELKEAIVIDQEKHKGLLKKSETIKQELTLLENVFNANLALMNLTDYRALLQEGTPCPCCGSTEHPYSIEKPTVNNKIEKQLLAKKEEQKNNDTEIRTIDNAISNKSYQKQNFENKVIELEVAISENTSQLDSYCTQLNIPTVSTIDEFNSFQDSIKLIIQNIRAHQLWNETKQPLLSYIELLCIYNEASEKLTTVKTERESFFGNHSIVSYKDELTKEWNTIINGIQTTEKEIKDNEERLLSTKNDFDILENQLKTKVIELGFDAIDSLQSVLLEASELNAIKQTKTQIDQLKVSLQTNKDSNHKAREQATKYDDGSITYEDVQSNITVLQSKRDIGLILQGELDKQVEINNLNKDKVAGLMSHLEVIQKERTYYATLEHLIGDQTGNKFNNIIQRITLRHLFNMTNNRLLTLMDRYQVDLGGEGQEDEIWVIDTYMGDEKRTINSVSGGERFVISLAMALSLSDLASSNVRIDSMFIDEGFGSLSPDDLDNAINMLERMQVENEKTIGIISHVESLKERISTQIQVEKLQNGESTLFLKSYEGVVSLATS
jgi:exonuclease SbcC